MEKRTLVINMEIDKIYLDKIKEVAPEWNVVSGKYEDIKEELKRAEIIANWNKGIESVIDENAKLKWIQSWSAGVNNLPLEKLEQKHVAITSANGVHAYPISETIFALMLGLTRNIHTYTRQQLEKKWHHANLELEMHEKTIGIFGVGAIGLETAKIAKAFGMKVLGVRHSGKAADYVDHMYRPDQMAEVLPQCDYVVITLPLTKETKHLFGTREFNLMKKNAFLINIGRGSIIVEDELITALKNKNIAGAGLDVFATEPLPEESPLWEMDNVIITPHTSGSTEHYTERVINDIFLPNLKRYLQDGMVEINLVDYKKGY